MADRRRILERKSIIEQQPITKWISVIETDGQSKQKRKHLVRFKQTRDVDSLKTDLTNTSVYNTHHKVHIAPRVEPPFSECGAFNLVSLPSASIIKLELFRHLSVLGAHSTVNLFVYI